MTDVIEIGTIGAPYGIKGQMHFCPLLSDVSALAHYTSFFDLHHHPLALKFKVSSAKKVFVAVKDINDRTAAEQWRGTRVFMPKTQLPALADGQFYFCDLVGMTILDKDGKPFGKIVQVANYGANDVLDIQKTDGTDELFAFCEATFSQIDTQKKTMVIDPPTFVEGDAHAL